MKTKLITAENKDGLVLGKREVEVAETMEELQEQFETKDILSLVYRSFVIDVQRELRAEATKGAPTDKAKVIKMIEKAMALLKAGDSSLYDTLVETGIINKK